jgi:hypothetical protein
MDALIILTCLLLAAWTIGTATFSALLVGLVVAKGNTR